MRLVDFSLETTRPRLSVARVGRGALDRLIEDLVACPPARLLVVVSDTRVAPLHAEPLAGRLRRRGQAVEMLTVPVGESSKSRETKAWLEDRLLEFGAGADTALIAVGGGVIGDLTGFVASTWHRGVPLVQVPTSLLAMVDAALGGKTAVNLPAGKNLIGSFHQPWGIYADISVLETLADEYYVDGFAEVVKTAVIGDLELFSRLESDVEALLAREVGTLESIVVRTVELKADVVRQDERDAGRRAILNFGHTVGHALESATAYTVRHGPAVAVGMTIEARLAEQATGFPEPARQRLESLLMRFGLPLRPAEPPPIELWVAATHSDKKTRAGRVRYALPLEIGRMPAGDGVTEVVDEDLLRSAIAASLGDARD